MDTLPLPLVGAVTCLVAFMVVFWRFQHHLALWRRTQHLDDVEPATGARSGPSGPSALQPGLELIGFSRNDDRSKSHYISASLLRQVGNRGIALGRDFMICDIVLNSQAVSARHARIIHDGQAYQIEDLNSANGTRVGATPVEPFSAVRLQNGVRVQLGDVELQVKIRL